MTVRLSAANNKTKKRNACPCSCCLSIMLTRLQYVCSPELPSKYSCTYNYSLDRHMPTEDLIGRKEVCRQLKAEAYTCDCNKPVHRLRYCFLKHCFCFVEKNTMAFTLTLLKKIIKGFAPRKQKPLEIKWLVPKTLLFALLLFLSK